jgi:hypothetical protein
MTYFHRTPPWNIQETMPINHHLFIPFQSVSLHQLAFKTLRGTLRGAFGKLATVQARFKLPAASPCRVSQPWLGTSTRFTGHGAQSARVGLQLHIYRTDMTVFFIHIEAESDVASKKSSALSGARDIPAMRPCFISSGLPTTSAITGGRQWAA